MRAKDRAATRIQAGFRGYRVRKQLRMATQGKRLNGPRRVSNVATEPAKTVPPREKASADAPTEASLAAAAEAARQRSATKIQAGVRGFLVRRRRLAQQKAASTIQAGFRAFRARREARLRTAATAK